MPNQSLINLMNLVISFLIWFGREFKKEDPDILDFYFHI